MPTQQSTIVNCAKCGTRNRITLGRGGAKCASCHAALPAHFPNAPVPVTDATFQRDVLAAPLPVLLDCWAAWCGPCRMLAPTLDAVAAKHTGRLIVAKLDTEHNPHTATSLQIQSIPTLIVFQSGRPIARQSGVLSGPQIDAWLQQAGVPL